MIHSLVLSGWSIKSIRSGLALKETCLDLNTSPVTGDHKAQFEPRYKKYAVSEMFG